MKAAVEIIGGEADAIRCQFLVDTRVNRAALFGRKSWVAWKTGIVSEGLIESRLHNPFPICGVQARITECTLGSPQHVGRTCARHPASPIGGVIFRACSNIECQAGEWLPARIEKTRLIVSPRVHIDETEKSVFNFIFVSGGKRKSTEKV